MDKSHVPSDSNAITPETPIGRIPLGRYLLLTRSGALRVTVERAAEQVLVLSAGVRTAEQPEQAPQRRREPAAPLRRSLGDRRASQQKLLAYIGTKHPKPVRVLDVHRQWKLHHIDSAAEYNAVRSDMMALYRKGFIEIVGERAATASENDLRGCAFRVASAWAGLLPQIIAQDIDLWAPATPPLPMPPAQNA